MNKNIRLGNTYEQKYLSTEYNFEEVAPKAGFVKSYKIGNKPNSQKFAGILNIMNDGRAVFNAKYTTYSGVQNKYSNYFSITHREIVHIKNSEKEEKKYFNL